MRHIAEPAHPTLSPDTALTDALARQAAEHPDRPLFASPVPGGEGEAAWRDVTAAEAWARVQGYARGLVAAGVGPGDHVAIMASTRLEWTLVDYAIWATFLPPAVTMISFFRPVMRRKPSSSREPRSPVRNQPSSVKASSFASGRLR